MAQAVSVLCQELGGKLGSFEYITENYPIDEVAASKEFYASELYSLLEQEDTNL